MPPEEKAREETLRAALEKKARPQNSLPAEIAPP
jgi:hypothetical protein